MFHRKKQTKSKQQNQNNNSTTATAPTNWLNGLASTAHAS